MAISNDDNRRILEWIGWTMKPMQSFGGFVDVLYSPAGDSYPFIGCVTIEDAWSHAPRVSESYDLAFEALSKVPKLGRLVVTYNLQNVSVICYIMYKEFCGEGHTLQEAICNAVLAYLDTIKQESKPNE
jgi:hypothetical protein